MRTPVPSVSLLVIAWVASAAGRADADMSAGPGIAVNSPEAGTADGTSMFHQFVVGGGWITWFILIPLSVVTVALLCHYLITIRRGTQVPVKLTRRLLQTARQGNLQQLAATARTSPTMLGQALYAGLCRLSAGRDAARAAMEEVLEDRAMRLLRRIEYLNIIGNLSPMIGLMGTVVGMIQAFHRIYAAGGAVTDASKLVGDIALALVNTFWGLLIAIPGLAGFAIFRNRVDGYTAEAARTCEQLIGALLEARSASATTAAASPANTGAVTAAGSTPSPGGPRPAARTETTPSR